MIDSKEKLSLSKQCTLLKINRNYLYYSPKFENAKNNSILQKIYLRHYSKGVQFLVTVIKPNRIYIANRTKENFYAAIQI